jgi:hypothetical protein
VVFNSYASLLSLQRLSPDFGLPFTISPGMIGLSWLRARMELAPIILSCLLRPIAPYLAVVCPPLARFVCLAAVLGAYATFVAHSSQMVRFVWPRYALHNCIDHFLHTWSA